MKFLQNKKNWGGPNFLGAGGDDNLSMKLNWPKYG
jgi:hypothetical protein